MKILITGMKGQLACEVYKELCNLGETPVALDEHELDITNYDLVWSTLHDLNPEIVINCGAYTNVDLCEKNQELAFKVNALGPKHLATTTYDMDATLIQISTDYVFDGDGDQPYREYDKPDPKSIYGKSKLFGEELVRAHNPRHFILRTAWLYGGGNNFLGTMLRLAQNRDELSIVDDQIGSPTPISELSRLICQLIPTRLYGTYHASCKGSCSWYEFASTIFDMMGIDITLKKITTAEFGRPAPRPSYSVLDNYMLDLLDMNTFHHWKTALEIFLLDHPSFQYT